MKKILARVILEFKPPLFQAWKTETVNRKCEVLEEKNVLNYDNHSRHSGDQEGEFRNDSKQVRILPISTKFN